MVRGSADLIEFQGQEGGETQTLTPNLIVHVVLDINVGALVEALSRCKEGLKTVRGLKDGR